MRAVQRRQAAMQTGRRATITGARVYDCVSSSAGRIRDNKLNYASLYRVTMRPRNYASTGTSSPDMLRL